MIKKAYNLLEKTWPRSGNVILAQFDEDTLVVYQAYRPEIGRFAVSNQYFGGEFSYGRMSWIKPNFLWMMYRCGWGRKAGQEVVLAVRLKRTFFDSILEQAVASSFDPASGFASQAHWKKALTASEVRLQWDPDHDPEGKKLARKAIQLGLRGDALREYGKDAVVDITDVTPFVTEQSRYAKGCFDGLLVPEEKIYIPRSDRARRNIGLDRTYQTGR